MSDRHSDEDDEEEEEDSPAELDERGPNVDWEFRMVCHAYL